jgi:DHA2 family multidrug resistance protein-like MFS transporter
MKARRASAVSFWVIGSWGGSGLCSFVGGAIATGLGWRWIFVFPLPSRWWRCCCCAARRKAVAPRAAAKLDISGLLSLIASLVLLNLFISKGHGWGWSSGLSLTMFAGSLLAAGFYPQRPAQRGRRAD